MKNSFPCLLILTEKHGTKYYHADDKTTLDNICHEIVIERNNEEWYEVESMSLREAVKFKDALKDSTKSFEFLKSRCNAEYEFVELVQYEN